MIRLRTGNVDLMKSQGRGVSEQLVTVLDPASAASEAFRTLRTRLLYAQVGDPKVILVTSPGSAEGKSVVCANLGVALAQAGKNTSILDCDLRRPMLHKIFELSDVPGLVNVLINEHKIEEAYQEPIPDLALSVLAAGPLPSNPAEILESRRLSELITGMREQFDYVLIDSAPTGLASDPTILATHADGVLLVLDAQKTHAEDIQGAIRSLMAVGANVLGTVVNNVKPSRESYY